MDLNKFNSLEPDHYFKLPKSWFQQTCTIHTNWTIKKPWQRFSNIQLKNVSWLKLVEKILRLYSTPISLLAESLLHNSNYIYLSCSLSIYIYTYIYGDSQEGTLFLYITYYLNRYMYTYMNWYVPCFGKDLFALSKKKYILTFAWVKKVAQKILQITIIWWTNPVFLSNYWN